MIQYLNIAMILVILLANTRRSQSNVLSVFKISRHGARAPNGPLQKEFMDLGALETADLTIVGRRQLKSLGRKFKQRYPHFKIYQTSFYSSYKTRAIYSMFSFLHQFMGNKKSSKHILNEKFFHSNKFKQFNNEQMLYLYNKRHYIEKVYQTAIARGLQTAIDAYCLKCVQPVNHIKQLKLVKHMYTNFYCRRGNGVDKSKYNNKLISLLKRGQMLFYDTVFLHENYVRAENNGPFSLLGKQLVSVANLSRHSGIDVTYYKRRFDISFKVNFAMFLFAHDRNVLSFIVALLGKEKVFTNTFYMPKFGSYVTVELIKGSCKMPSYSDISFFETKDEDGYHVRLVYQDREIFTKACGYTLCSLKEFLEFLDRNLGT